MYNVYHSVIVYLVGGADTLAVYLVMSGEEEYIRDCAKRDLQVSFQTMGGRHGRRTLGSVS